MATRTTPPLHGTHDEAVRRVRVYGTCAAADAEVRRSAEAVQQGGCAAGDTPRQDTEAAEPAVEGVSREATEAARDTAEGVHRMAVAPPGAAEGGPRGFQQGVAGLFGGVARTNLRVTQELFRLSDAVPMAELQRRFAREHADMRLQNSAALVCAAPPTRRCARGSSRSSSAAEPTKTTRAPTPRRSSRRARAAGVRGVERDGRGASGTPAVSAPGAPFHWWDEASTFLRSRHNPRRHVSPRQSPPRA